LIAVDGVHYVNDTLTLNCLDSLRPSVNVCNIRIAQTRLICFLIGSKILKYLQYFATN
jgi:hypothetical protein